MRRVILEQMGQRGSISQIINTNNIDVDSALLHCTKHQTSDATKSIDGDVEGHEFFRSMMI